MAHHLEMNHIVHALPLNINTISVFCCFALFLGDCYCVTFRIFSLHIWASCLAQVDVHSLSCCSFFTPICDVNAFDCGLWFQENQLLWKTCFSFDFCLTTLTRLVRVHDDWLWGGWMVFVLFRFVNWFICISGPSIYKYAFALASKYIIYCLNKIESLFA